MKQIILLTAILLLSASIFGQQSNFKVKNKKPVGTTVTNLNAKKTNGSTNLKSASTVSYKAAQTLAKPTLAKNSTGLLRKIEKNNALIFIEKEAPTLKSASIKPAEERFYTFFESIQTATKLKNNRESFSIKTIETDKLEMTHIKSVQLYKGVEIYGTESTLHLDTKRERFTGKIVNISNEIDVVPTLQPSGAIDKAVENLKQKTVVKELSDKEKKILKYESPRSKLVVFENSNNSFSLAYEVEARPNFIEIWKYFIDAHTGEILKSFNATNSDGPTSATAYDLNNTLRQVNTYLEKGTYYMIDISEAMFNSTKFEGAIFTFNANNTSTQNLDYSYINSTNNTWSNKTAVSAHANTMASYKYFYTTFGRNSLNGNGGNIMSFINVTEDDGSSMDNAFWNGEAAFYGNGSMFKPLAGAQDVISHELGHGVVSNTANLEYYSQSGAINETYADIFGSMVDRDDWLIGEDVVKTAYYPSGTLRDMSNPHNSGTSSDYWWQPAHVSEMYIGEEDNAGVHTNSGIGNHAYYLCATSIGKDKAEQIFYRALANYLTKNSQFIDFRIAVVQSAKDLYGENSNEVAKAAEAFDKVGIYNEEPVVVSSDYEVNNGDEYLLTYNTDTQYSDKLDRCSPSGSDIKLMTKTDMKGKASVTDDGAVAIFVSPDDKIRRLFLDPNDLAEDILSDEAFWDNVAVSKDGMRIAGISNEIDASIWVYDFGTEKWNQFQLYNPTTSNDNTNAGGVKYADEIDFDITGEYIIYDAYNEFTSTYTDDISYWDIGFIKIWDNTNDTWGDGSISKLFGSLPKGVSIGNPVFSKNSSNIIAFDYLDEANEDYAIFGADLQTGDLDVIYTNTTLGFPSFSRLDNQIAFSSTYTTGEAVIAGINLAANKISASGDAYPIIEMAQWPVFYATGTRTLGLAPVANFSVDYKNGSAPFSVRFIDASSNNPTSWNWTFKGGTPSSSILQNPTVTYNNDGTYEVTLKASNEYGDNTITKTDYIKIYKTGIDKHKIDVISFYPNPVKNTLNINCNDDFTMKLFNIDGKLMLEHSNQKTVDVSKIKPGIYFIELETGGSKIRNKIVLNN